MKKIKLLRSLGRFFPPREFQKQNHPVDRQAKTVPSPKIWENLRKSLKNQD
jgi:hypothetical protein